MNVETQKVKSSINERIKGALLFAPIVLLSVYFGGWFFTIVLSYGASIAVREWGTMVLSGSRDVPSFLIRGADILAGIALIALGMTGNLSMLLYLTFAFCILLYIYNTLRHGASLALFLPGFVYIVMSLGLLHWLRAGTSVHGLYNTLTILFVVWGTDVMAYTSGRIIGGPKLAPMISPKKTWAGLVGGVLGAAAIAAGVTCPILTDALDVDTIGYMTWLFYALMGAALACVGQAGDLLVSYFKRQFAVKDTGMLIPGHGGLLDRIDGLLLATYVFAVIAWIGG